MNTARQKLSARDYKDGGRRAGGGLAQFRQFGLGLGAGLLVALFVWLQGQRAQSVQDAAPVADASAATPEVAPAAEPDPVDQLDFYENLPNFELVVPQADGVSRGDASSVPVTLPGIYVVQAGSFRSRPDAEKQRERLGKLGIESTVQHVTIDESEWHRVIVGPTRDIARVNTARLTLRDAQVVFRIYRLGE